MPTVNELKKTARREGMKGYSKLRKEELVFALDHVPVFKGDLKITRKLGADFLRTCGVTGWDKKGRGRFERYVPQGWWVSRFRLKGYDPISEEQARAKRERMGEAAKAAYNNRMEIAADAIGALPDSWAARAYSRGELDFDEAELISFKTYYRHEHTNYDELIRETRDREWSRSEAREEPIPDTWQEYLEKYGFYSIEALFLSRTLRSAREAHPIWFKKAEIAVRKSELKLADLTYEGVADAVNSTFPRYSEY